MRWALVLATAADERVRRGRHGRPGARADRGRGAARSPSCGARVGETVPPFRATYRLQLGPDLDFAGARGARPVPRASSACPISTSRPRCRRGTARRTGTTWSTRRAISDDLGGEGAFRALCAHASAAGLGDRARHRPQPHGGERGGEPVLARSPAPGQVLRPRLADRVSRRFFDIGDLAGVRMEDPEVFEALSRKVIELVGEGLVDGLRIDHADGLAFPARYLRRLAEPGSGTSGSRRSSSRASPCANGRSRGRRATSSSNDVTALFVNPEAEEPFTELYGGLTGETRPFARARGRGEARAGARRPSTGRSSGSRRGSATQRRASTSRPRSPRSRSTAPTSTPTPARWRARPRRRPGGADCRPSWRAILLLEERGHDAFVIRFQQTTPPVIAKGVEDTAFYRYNRLLALNEVGGDPGRWSRLGRGLPCREPGARGALPTRRCSRRRRTTRSARATSARGSSPLTWMPDEWAAFVHGVRVPGDVDPNDAYLVLQTLVGAWPLTRSVSTATWRRRSGRGSCARTGSTRTSATSGASRSSRWSLAEVVAAVRRAGCAARRADRARADAAQAHVPGRPRHLPGRRARVAEPRRPGQPPARRLGRTPRGRSPTRRRSCALIREALALRARRPDAFAGTYEPVDAGPDVSPSAAAARCWSRFPCARGSSSILPRAGSRSCPASTSEADRTSAPRARGRTRPRCARPSGAARPSCAG